MAKPQSPLCQCGHSRGWHAAGCRRCSCSEFRVPDLMAALKASLDAAASREEDAK
jgi:hypothetical protein